MSPRAGLAVFLTLAILPTTANADSIALAERALREMAAQREGLRAVLGTIHADDPPFVILTSNRTRDVHDALKRRCLYHWVEHPDFEREVEIVRLRAPQVSEPLARQVAAATEAMRGYGLYKPPGVAESIDWAMSLAALGRQELDESSVAATLGSVLKYREDQQRVADQGLPELVRHAIDRGAAIRGGSG